MGLFFFRAPSPLGVLLILAVLDEVDDTTDAATGAEFRATSSSLDTSLGSAAASAKQSCTTSKYRGTGERG
jgi:hypothetical protein